MLMKIIFLSMFSTLASISFAAPKMESMNKSSEISRLDTLASLLRYDYKILLDTENCDQKTAILCEQFLEALAVGQEIFQNDKHYSIKIKNYRLLRNEQSSQLETVANTRTYLQVETGITFYINRNKQRVDIRLPEAAVTANLDHYRQPRAAYDLLRLIEFSIHDETEGWSHSLY